MHIPVMKDEVIQLLRVKEGGLYFDCTFGQGGHSLAILEHGGVVVALDRDLSTEKYAKDLKLAFPDSFFWVHSSFVNLLTVWRSLAFPMKPDGILLDLGFSSNQIEDSERGFSFLYDSNLDMRYDTSNDGMTALYCINHLSEQILAKIFFDFGEERLGFKIAKKICEARKIKKISSCFELLSILRCFDFHSGKHFATKIFQALRIFVNDELSQIELCLKDAIDLIKFYGRILVISFHSLEDRIVKGIFRNKNLRYPSENEILNNPRSRSAKLRWFLNQKEVS